MLSIIRISVFVLLSSAANAETSHRALNSETIYNTLYEEAISGSDKKINLRCSLQWNQNAELREFCKVEMRKSLDFLRAYNGRMGQNLGASPRYAGLCIERYSDDYRSVQKCIRQMSASWDSIQVLYGDDEIPGEIRRDAGSYCRGVWDLEFDLLAACITEQIQDWRTIQR